MILICKNNELHLNTLTIGKSYNVISQRTIYWSSNPSSVSYRTDGGFGKFNDDDFILFTILADDGNEREYRKDSLLFLSTSEYREQIINKILR
jgi:hypothetical protein